MNARETIKNKLKTIPQELISYPNWICWRFVERDGRVTKMPIDPKTGKAAKADDPTTWAPFTVAAKAAAQSSDLGIGFQFGNSPFVGIDFDYKSYAGEGMPDMVETVVDMMSSYTEISPSGKGCHVIVEAELLDGYKSRTQIEGAELEVYGTGRMFTITGDVYGKYTDMHTRQYELDALLDMFLERPEVERTGERPTVLVDGSIIATAIKRDGLLAALYSGDTSDYGNDHSRADAALVMKLAFWLQGDPELIDNAFRASGLYRQKWDDRHSGDGRTYGEMTIQSTLARWNGECFRPSNSANLDSVRSAYNDAALDILKAGADVIDQSQGHGMTKISMRKIWFELIEFIKAGKIMHAPGKGYYLSFGGLTGLATVLGDSNYQALRTRLMQFSDLGFFRGFGQLDPSERVSQFVLWLPEDPQELGIMKLKPSKSISLQAARQVKAIKSPTRLAPTKEYTVRVRSILPALRCVAYRLSLGDSTIAKLSDSTGVSTRALKANVERLISLGLAKNEDGHISLTQDFEVAALVEREANPKYRARVESHLQKQSNHKDKSVAKNATERLTMLHDGYGVRDIYLGAL